MDSKSCLFYVEKKTNFDYNLHKWMRSEPSRLFIQKDKANGGTEGDMVNICILEDEKKHYDVLNNYIDRYAKEKPLDYRVTWVTDGMDLVDDYKSQYDVIFLDIQMKHLDGMTAAEKIRSIDKNVIMIFITSTVQYAVQGYTVDALGYVLKPVPYIAFEKIFEKALERLQAKSEKTYIRIAIEDKQIKLDCDSILYIESQRNYVIIHCEREKHKTAGPLKRFEEMLSEHGFCKCHNAYLINLSKVDAVKKDEVILASGEVLPISRARKKEFMDGLTNDIL